MSDIYSELLSKMGSLESEDHSIGGFDDYLSGKNTVKVASIDDFFNFLRIGSTTLVHKAEHDLWKVGENDAGEVVIERLFDPTTKEPLKV
jgi:hypothetical protein